MHYVCKSLCFSDLAKAEKYRVARELRVPMYVIRNARPTDRHFSFPSCHMIVVNPAI